MPGQMAVNPKFTGIPKVLITFILFLALGVLIAGYQQLDWYRLDLYGIGSFFVLGAVLLLCQYMLMWGWNQAYEHNSYGTATGMGILAFIIYLFSVALISWGFGAVYTVDSFLTTLYGEIALAFLPYIAFIANAFVTVEVEDW